MLTDPPRTVAPLRVLRVLSALNVGGTELRAAEIVPRLAEAGAQVHLVPLGVDVGTGPLADVVVDNGGTVTPVPLDLRFPVRLVRVMHRVRPAAVHVDCANFSGLPLTLAALSGVPVRVAHFHGDDNLPRGRRRRILRWAGNRLLRLSATDIIAVAPSSLECGMGPDWRSDPRCQVVLSGLDLDRLCRPGLVELRALVGAEVGDLLLLTVGRPSPEKRRWLMPSILAALRTRGVRAHAIFVGPREEQDDARLLAAAAELAVTDQVHLIGVRDDVGALLRQADAVVHPSCLEGLPGAVLESAALGIGTVAADLPGVRFIAAELPGVGVVPMDAPAAEWADAVIEAVGFTADSDPDVATDRFRRSVFALDAAVSTHLTIYRRRGVRPDRVGRRNGEG